MSVLVALLVAQCASAFTLSNTLGDHMVLQRDARSPPAIVWGFAAAGVTIKTTFQGNTFTTTTGSDGVWRQALPPTPAGGPYTISFTGSDGGSAALNDVLFGDVYLCSGQSNMQFAVSNGFNASQEAQRANQYPTIRVFTVGQGTQSPAPLQELKTIEQQWSVANASSIGGPQWGYFSAVCWFFGRTLHDALGGNVPMGLISDNWGGTPIQHWSSPDALAACKAPADSVLWNAMMVPYAVGPMSLKGFTWYQAESNVGQTDYYACAFPAMISDWRKKFNNPSAWFGFVQLAAWPGGTGTTVADMRTAQLAALKLPLVGFASAVDLGDAPGGIHPRDKQDVGLRLANYALYQVYRQSAPHLYPMYSSSSATTLGKTITVTVRFDPATLPGTLHLVPAACPSDVPANNCDGFDIQLGDAGKSWINATAAIGADGRSLVLTATAPVTGLRAIGCRYAQSSWPVISLYSSENLPAIPWTAALTTARPAARPRPRPRLE